MKINTNIAAITASGHLNRTQDKITTSLERLSSGYRINKAADDAAGMAISSKMKAQIRGLQRASRNGADGISFIQTAEGALSEVENMLQRCRELSVQAANTGVYAIDDREAIQKRSMPCEKRSTGFRQTQNSIQRVFLTVLVAVRLLPIISV